MIDMLCHWRYLVDNVFGSIKSISCRGATHVAERIDEQGNPYKCTADDSCYATMELENGILCQFNSSWTVRVRRDDLFVMQVDGSKGSAVVGRCVSAVLSPLLKLPVPVWNPDVVQPIDFYEGWKKLKTIRTMTMLLKCNGNFFFAMWHLMNHFPYDLRSGARAWNLPRYPGIQSWKERKWIDL